MSSLEQIEQKKLPFDVFQIDEGWEKTLGWWEANEKFPMPMEEIAARIRAAGLIPGIWTSPFVAKETAPVWQEHPDWVLRDHNGQPCIFPMNDTTYWVYDITVPETRDYFTELYRHLTFDWGYTYHKLDFTRAAIAPHSAAVVKIERIGDAPLVVASDGHYSMGLEIERLAANDSELILEHDNRFARPIHMEVLLPESGRIASVTLPGMRHCRIHVPLHL